MVTDMRILLLTALVSVTALHTAWAQGDWSERPYRRGDGVHIRIGRNYVLPAGEVSTRPVIVIGGSVTIDGRAENDFVIIGGPVRVGPTAEVRADLVSVGGEVAVSDTARISGEIHDVSVFWPELRVALSDWWWNIDEAWWAMFSLVGTVFRLALVMVGACCMALIAPGWVRRIERTAAGTPFVSGVLGLTLQLLFVPLLVITVIGMIITIVGIPLLILVPFALFAFGLVWLAGFAGVAAQIGGRLRGRMAGATDSPVLDTAFGVAALGLVTMVGGLLAVGPWLFTPPAAAFTTAGLIIEYLAWTVGLGAGLVAPFRRRWPSTPPPIPAHAPFTASA